MLKKTLKSLIMKTTSSQLENGTKSSVLNLAKGFPGYFKGNPVYKYMVEGVNADLNQYTRFMGYPPLAEQIAIHYTPILKHEIEPMTDSIVVPGLKAAFSIYCSTVLTKGATVVTFEPFNSDWVNFLKKEGFDVKVFPRNFSFETAEFEEALSKAELLLLSNAGSDLATPFPLSHLQYLAI